ncbi:hypothetical protein [Streptomyces sp. NPDC053427]|uniref:hypothetical protein n=1 Tax=Streptomyces sp. NPDC053427 TaxID=3365701 RepID=UPI0037D9059C
MKNLLSVARRERQLADGDEQEKQTTPAVRDARDLRGPPPHDRCRDHTKQDQRSHFNANASH